jgi:hypothetical protein
MHFKEKAIAALQTENLSLKDKTQIQEMLKKADDGEWESLGKAHKLHALIQKCRQAAGK